MAFFDGLVDFLSGKGGAPSPVVVIVPAAQAGMAIAPQALSALRAAGTPPPGLTPKAGARGISPATLQAISGAYPGGLPPEVLAAMQSHGVTPEMLATIAGGAPLAQDKAKTRLASPHARPHKASPELPVAAPMPTGSDPIAAPAYPFTAHWTPSALRALYDAQTALGLDPRKGGLAGLIQEESEGIPVALNPLPAAGLIQLTTGAKLPGFTTPEAIRAIAGSPPHYEGAMSTEEQLQRIVVPLYRRFHGNYGDQSVGDLMLLNSGAGVGHDPNEKWGDSKGTDWQKKVYAANGRAYDKAGKGFITFGDLLAKGREVEALSGGKFVTVSGKIVDGGGAPAAAPADTAKAVHNKAMSVQSIARRQASMNPGPRAVAARSASGGAGGLPQPPRGAPDLTDDEDKALLAKARKAGQLAPEPGTPEIADDSEAADPPPPNAARAAQDKAVEDSVAKARTYATEKHQADLAVARARAKVNEGKAAGAALPNYDPDELHKANQPYAPADDDGSADAERQRLDAANRAKTYENEQRQLRSQYPDPKETV